MPELTVCKAQPVSKDAPTPDTHIHISAEAPEFRDLEVWDVYCQEEARQLELALVGALPGGVYDRLLGLMLARKASQFRVAYAEVRGGG